MFILGFGKPFPESRSIPVHLNSPAAPSIIESKPTPVNNTAPANSAFDLLGMYTVYSVYDITHLE